MTASFSQGHCFHPQYLLKAGGAKALSFGVFYLSESAMSFEKLLGAGPEVNGYKRHIKG